MKKIYKNLWYDEKEGKYLFYDGKEKRYVVEQEAYLLIYLIEIMLGVKR